MSQFHRRILCIGAGHVGGPTMAVVAARCPQYEVTVVDVNADRIRAWQTDRLPIYEPGLLEVVRQARGRNLFFSTDVPAAIDRADIIFVSVNTPTPSGAPARGRLGRQRRDPPRTGPGRAARRRVGCLSIARLPEDLRFDGEACLRLRRPQPARSPGPPRHRFQRVPNRKAGLEARLSEGSNRTLRPRQPVWA